MWNLGNLFVRIVKNLNHQLIYVLTTQIILKFFLQGQLKHYNNRKRKSWRKSKKTFHLLNHTYLNLNFVPFNIFFNKISIQTKDLYRMFYFVYSLQIKSTGNVFELCGKFHLPIY